MSPSHSILAAAATALLVLATAGGAATAGSAPSAGLELALLAAEDLPADLQPSGVTHDPTFDIDEASYVEAGGVDRVQQLWQAAKVLPTSRVVIVFDFRMVFPTQEAAQAYLEAAEPILSEAVTGLELQADTPTLGQASRHYAGTLSQGSVTISVQNLLYRVGPVVGKVFVGGFDTTFEDLLPIAMAAGARTEAWVIAQLLASPEPSLPPASLAPATMVLATFGPDLTTTPGGSTAPAGSELRQWAVEATASSQYGSDSWSARRATGEPDVDSYVDDTDAWTTASSDGGIEWLELGYAQAVVPTQVNIVESLGNGSVILVEAYDAAQDGWVRLWSGDDPTPDELATFSPPIESISLATDRLRITIDTARVPGWNEIDAVELVGSVP